MIKNSKPSYSKLIKNGFGTYKTKKMTKDSILISTRTYNRILPTMAPTSGSLFMRKTVSEEEKA